MTLFSAFARNPIVVLETSDYNRAWSHVIKVCQRLEVEGNENGVASDFITETARQEVGRNNVYGCVLSYGEACVRAALDHVEQLVRERADESRQHEAVALRQLANQIAVLRSPKA